MSSLIYTDHANKSRGREFLFLMKAAKKENKNRKKDQIKLNEIFNKTSILKMMCDECEL